MKQRKVLENREQIVINRVFHVLHLFFQAVREEARNERASGTDREHDPHEARCGRTTHPDHLQPSHQPDHQVHTPRPRNRLQ